MQPGRIENSDKNDPLPDKQNMPLPRPQQRLTGEPRLSLSPGALTPHSTQIPSQCNQARKGNKRRIDWKRIKLFADDVIAYVENPYKSTKICNSVIHELSKIAG